MREKSDEREDMIATHQSLVEEEGTDIAWIAKVSAGAKGVFFIFS